MNGARGYGHDETEDFETLAEAERNEDGTVTIRTVQIDKRDAGGSTEQGGKPIAGDKS